MMKRLLLFLLCGLRLYAFAQTPYPSPLPQAAKIIKAEYFFDTDPGPGQATALAITPATDVNTTAALALNGSALANGFHRLYIRTMDEVGRWSHTANTFFDNYVLPLYAMQSPVVDVVEAEYFIDVDPGLGLAKKILFTADTSVALSGYAIDITGISIGVHRLFVRSKSATGKWSLTYFGLFDNSSGPAYPTAPAAPAAITKLEYYLDADPGFGNGTVIPVASGADLQNISFNIPVASLPQGRHTIYVRSKTIPWSISAYSDFFIGSILPLQWVQVKGEVVNSDASISWTTAAENEIAKFIIEYSNDGSHFKPVGEVMAANTSGNHSYHFQHQNVPEGFAFYRIRQLDKDGKFSYSKVIQLLVKKAGKSLVFPNPAQDFVYVLLPDASTVATIKLLNSAGVLLHQIEGKNISGNLLTIPLQKYPSGTYFIQLQTKAGLQNLSFIKQ